MRTKTIWFVLTLAKLLFLASADDTVEFNPITEGVSFKTLYNVVRYTNNHFEFEYDVYEQYDAKTKSASIWLEANNKKQLERRRFLYLGDSQMDVELPVSESDQQIPDDLSKIDKGYDLAVDQTDQLLDQFKPLRIVPETEGLDELLLGFGPKSKIRFYMDAYLKKRCKQKVNDKLGYVRGLSRILHMIECRRWEFFNNVRDVRKSEHREVKVKTFMFSGEPEEKSAAKEALVCSLKRVYVDLGPESSNSRETVLPGRAVPLYIRLEFDHGIDIYIEVYQFEVVDSLTSSIEFLIPPGRGYSIALASGTLPSRSSAFSDMRRKVRNGYSFRATLTGPSIPLLYPLELLVAFDQSKQTLAFQKITTEDRIRSAGGLRRSVMREVYDGQSTLKFHIMHSTGDQVKPLAGPRYPGIWKSCVVDTISNYHAQELETGHTHIFDPTGAIMMGYAQVRGVLCQVYEKRVFGFPPWLGLGESSVSLLADDFTMVDAKMFSIFFISLADHKNLDEGKLMRIEVRILSNTDQRLLHRFEVDVFSFMWSTVSIVESHEQVDLFEVKRECILTDLTLRHLEMKLELEPIKLPADEREKITTLEMLRGIEKLREESVSSMLSRTAFEISKVQQADLKCWMTSADRLAVHLTVHELPKVKTSIHVIGFATDLSTWHEEYGVWSVGATSSSLQECQSRAAHSLDSSLLDTQSGEVSQVYMYCPRTLHCMLIDQQLNISSKLHVDSIISFPVQPAREACLVAKVRLEEHSQQIMGRFDIFNRLISHERQVYLKALDYDIYVDRGLGSLGRPSAVTYKINDLQISQTYDKLTNMAISRLKGFTYFPPEDVEPIQVRSVAQCNQACMIHHDCASYSICHKLYDSYNLDCLLTRVNWTHQDEILKTVDLFNQPDVRDNPNPSVVTDLSIGYEQNLEVRFIKSQLCSLHPRQRVFLFRKITSPWMEEKASATSILATRDINQCADLCIHRASLINLVKERLNLSHEKREESCIMFRYNDKQGRCHLLPRYDLGEVYEKLDPQNKLAKKFLRAKFSGDLKTQEHRYISSDLYYLIYEQVFSNDHRNRQLEVIPASDDKIDNSRVVDAPEDCARHCLQRRFCESFDVLPLTDDPNGSKLSCILNFFSGAHTSANVGPWHYEPTELAYHIMGFEWAAEEKTDSSGVYIKVKSSDLPSNALEESKMSVEVFETKPVGWAVNLVMLFVIVVILVLVLWKNYDNIRSLALSTVTKGVQVR